MNYENDTHQRKKKEKKKISNKFQEKISKVKMFCSVRYIQEMDTINQIIEPQILK